ncbi:MAG TPA: hypothetical protein H9881_08400 [Candidatus Stackebrandtia excrementipullorum]|nr:hypothetical protein [Candidatus Stackebrandtia excrementipullorum]
MDNRYTYFVTFAHPQGSGMIEIHMNRPVTTWDDIRGMTEVVKSSVNNPAPAWVTLTGYQLMSGPDTCTTCGR